jgi:hypothetical protein
VPPYLPQILAAAVATAVAAVILFLLHIFYLSVKTGEHIHIFITIAIYELLELQTTFNTDYADIFSSISIPNFKRLSPKVH